jgi:hypothetical protein
MTESNHYVYLQRAAAVVAAIRAFLLEGATPSPPVATRPVRAGS